MRLSLSDPVDICRVLSNRQSRGQAWAFASTAEMEGTHVVTWAIPGDLGKYRLTQRQSQSLTGKVRNLRRNLLKILTVVLFHLFPSFLILNSWKFGFKK